MDESFLLKLRDLSRIISHMVEIQLQDDQLTKYVRVLSLACSGPESDRFTTTFSSMFTPSEMLEILLRYREFTEKVFKSPENCRRLVLTFLNLSRWSKGVLRFLQEALPPLLRSGEDRELIIGQLREHKDLSSLPAEIGEVLLQEDPLFVEKSILTSLKCSKDSENLWAESNNHHWVSWGSNSSLIFSGVTSILNELLVTLPCSGFLLQVIRNYVNLVKGKCEEEGKDFVGLYPPEVRSLVVLLLLGKILVGECSMEGVVIGMFEKIEVKARLALVSHFPEWEPLLNDNRSVQDLWNG